MSFITQEDFKVVSSEASLKAIMGVAGYAKMAEIRGNADVAKR